MWFQILAENVSHAVAFALAAHNANLTLFTYDLSAAFNVPKQWRTKPEDNA